MALRWFRLYFLSICSLSLLQLICFIKAKDDSLSMIFVGDISFDDCLKYYVGHRYYSYNDTMSKVADVIREADISVGNLESPFVDETMIKDQIISSRKSVFLDADPLSVNALKFAGFDVMSLSHNHLNDYGEKPLNLTKNVLNSVGIQSFGYNYNQYDTPQPLIIEKKGIRVGFLGYCDVIPSKARYYNCTHTRKMFKAGPAIYSDHIAARDIQLLKRKSIDVIVIYLHWGKEYTTRPLKRQLHIAKYLHSLGASIVVGGHPHTLQSHSQTKHQLTAYSLGNFLFPQHGTSMTIFRRQYLGNITKQKIAKFEREATALRSPSAFSRILRIEINRKGVVDAKYLPVEIKFDPSTKILQPILTNGTNWIDVCAPKDESCLQQRKQSPT